MNKEMIEIMEIKDNLKELQKTTEEEIAKINKKVKDGKVENKKLIQTKFEEMMDTLHFNIENNPNMPKIEKISNEDEINELT